jgi:hypothetical protein
MFAVFDGSPFCGFADSLVLTIGSDDSVGYTSPTQSKHRKRLGSFRVSHVPPNLRPFYKVVFDVKKWIDTYTKQNYRMSRRTLHVRFCSSTFTPFPFSACFRLSVLPPLCVVLTRKWCWVFDYWMLLTDFVEANQWRSGRCRRDVENEAPHRFWQRPRDLLGYVPYRYFHI